MHNPTAAPLQAQPAAPLLFTRWDRSLDDTSLVLTLQDGRRIVELVELDVRDLPDRPDLLPRLGPIARDRLLRDAAASRLEVRP